MEAEQPCLGSASRSLSTVATSRPAPIRTSGAEARRGHPQPGALGRPLADIVIATPSSTARASSAGRAPAPEISAEQRLEPVDVRDEVIE